MARRDIFAVKNGNCYMYMGYNRLFAINRLIVERDHNRRLGLMQSVKLVHPPEAGVAVYAAANGLLDK